MLTRKLLLIVLVVLSSQLFAQPGSYAPGFTDGGVFTVSYGSIFERVLVFPDKKVLVVYSVYVSADPYPDFTYSVFRKYNADGTPDNTFGDNGYESFDFSHEYHHQFESLVMQPDGKFVAMEKNTPNVWRFNQDGSLDKSFGVDGISTITLPAVTFHFNAIALDAQNRIIVSGYAEASGLDRSMAVARINPDGTQDESFNSVGVRIILETNDQSYTGKYCGVGPDGKVVVAVENMLGDLNIKFDSYIMRFNENGTIDQAFGTQGRHTFQQSFRGLQVDGNGKTVYGLNSRIYPQLTGGLFSLNATGTSSATIRASGFSTFIIQPDNKIVVMDSYQNITGQYPATSIARYTAGGSNDPSFGNNGSQKIDLGFTTNGRDLFYSDRRIYMAGYVVTDNNHGLVTVLDATDIKLTCPHPLTPYNVNAGTCSATITNIDPILTPGTLQADIQHTKTFNSILTTGTGTLNGQTFYPGTTSITYSYEDLTKQTCGFNVTVNDNDPPTVKTKNLTVTLDATGNASITASQVDNGSSDGCGIQTRSLDVSSFSCANVGPNTVTLTVTDVNGNSATGTATVTVQDLTPPVVRTKNITAYLDATGNVSIAAADINNGSSDECGTVTLSINKSAFSCADKGPNTVTLTATDPNSNTASTTATVTVVDNLPPVITSVTTDPSSLWPSDRKLKPVTITTAATDNCPGVTWKITAVAIKAGVLANDNKEPDWEITGDHTVNLRAEVPRKGVKRVYTLTITATDASGNTATSTADVMVSHNINTPVSGAVVKIGSTVNLSGEFWDKAGRTHTAKWFIDDNTTVKAGLTEPTANANGTVTGSYKFAAAGVYSLQMNVTDQSGITSFANTCDNLDAILVVYDPNGGYTYGGGNFYSPAGALKSNPALAGDVSYGFTVNYYKGATTPKGETEFSFKLGDFEYNALNFDYLAMSGAKAQFKGTGKIIGGQSGVAFIMTVIDGSLDGTGINKVRMKIYNKNTGQVYYDNEPGASDAADPKTRVGANSTVVIVNNAKAETELVQGGEEKRSLTEDLFTGKALAVTAYPNPYTNAFSLRIQSPVSGMATIELYTILGQKVYEGKKAVQAGAGNQFSYTDRQHYGSLIYRVTIGDSKQSGMVAHPN